MAIKKAVRSGARLEAAESTRDYMREGVAQVCGAFRGRAAGTQAERDAQAFFKQELEGYADEVTPEDFELRPGAFSGSVAIAAGCVLASIPMFLFNNGSALLAVLAAVLNILAVLTALFEFFFCRPFVDFLFPKRVSRNVYALRRPSGEVKRRIIFGGHSDAAYESRWLRLLKKKSALVTLGALVGAAVSLAASLVNAVYIILTRSYGTGFDSKWEGGWLAWSVLLLLSAVPCAMLLFFTDYKTITDGASGSLSASYAAMSVLKEMHDSDVRFEHTEVACLLTGAGEAGLRGAKAFAQAHMAQLSDPNVETVFIAMDALCGIDRLRLHTSGCMGTVQNDLALGELLRDAGRSCGVELPDGAWYSGAADSEAFSMQGLRAAGFTGASRHRNTREDTADNIDLDAMALSLNICKEAARLFDEHEGMGNWDDMGMQK